MISFEGVSVARNFFHFRFMLKKFGKKLKTTDEKYSGDKPEYEPITNQNFLVFKGVSIVRISGNKDIKLYWRNK